MELKTFNPKSRTWVKDSREIAKGATIESAASVRSYDFQKTYGIFKAGEIEPSVVYINGTRYEQLNLKPIPVITVEEAQHCKTCGEELVFVGWMGNKGQIYLCQHCQSKNVPAIHMDISLAINGKLTDAQITELYEQEQFSDWALDAHSGMSYLSKQVNTINEISNAVSALRAILSK